MWDKYPPKWIIIVILPNGKRMIKIQFKMWIDSNACDTNLYTHVIILMMLLMSD